LILFVSMTYKMAGPSEGAKSLPTTGASWLAQAANLMATLAPVPAYTLKTILQHRPFRMLWLAQFVSIFGDFLALFGVINLITFTWHGSAVTGYGGDHRLRSAAGHHRTDDRRVRRPLEPPSSS
jgi:hypothetical protein